jgi:hypothetical protein
VVAIDDVIGQGRVLASPLAMGDCRRLGGRWTTGHYESNQLQAMMRAAVVSGSATSR